MEKISVIVPVYQVEPYLDKCVSSIVNQSYRNLEIILVDDGSPDRCPEMCDQWAKKDGRIRVIHKENGGLSDARNAGLAIATGELIGFVDSDDWINKEFFKMLYEAMVQTQTDIVACDYREIYHEEDEVLYDDKCVKLAVATPEEAISDMMCNRRFRTVVWNKLYRRNLLEDNCFLVNRLHEDEFFTYQVYDRAKMLAYIDVPLYMYRQRPGSIMASSSSGHTDVLYAYLGRIQLLERKYPRLVLRDKINFCTTCLNLYAFSLHSANKEKNQNCIRSCRKEVHFTRNEFFACTLKEKMYVLLSWGMWIRVGAWIRRRRDG